MQFGCTSPLKNEGGKDQRKKSMKHYKIPIEKYGTRNKNQKTRNTNGKHVYSTVM